LTLHFFDFFDMDDNSSVSPTVNDLLEGLEAADFEAEGPSPETQENLNHLEGLEASHFEWTQFDAGTQELVSNIIAGIIAKDFHSQADGDDVILLLEGFSADDFTENPTEDYQQLDLLHGLTAEDFMKE